MAAKADPPFGRLLTAMVTPFASGRLGRPRRRRGARDAIWSTSRRTTASWSTGRAARPRPRRDAEKADLVRAVVDAVGDRAHVVAGVGTNDTAHTLELAAAAEKAGADGLLAVTPYYSKPPAGRARRALPHRSPTRPGCR